MENFKGIEYLRKKLNVVAPRVATRYELYDMKKIDLDVGVTIPPQIRQRFRATLGWTSKAVDTLADRLRFKGFENDSFMLDDIFKINNPDIFYDSAILSALIGSCSFIYISKDKEENIRLQVIEGNNATGIIDPITNLLTEGYAVLQRDGMGKPTEELYFLPNKTIHYKGGEEYYTYEHDAPYALLVPIIHRPDAVRPFGRSRITRSAMYYQKYAKRTMERADITAEFYSFPQKYVLGMDPNADSWDSWKATVSSMLRIDKDEDGDRPVLGQFTSPSMTPFIEQMRMCASGFAGETGLTLDDLGYISDNPSSSEAIKASHETLRLMASKAQRCFGSGFLNVGYLASCLRDNQPYKRNAFYDVKPSWYPVFEPDSSTLSVIGDGAIKINQAVPGYFNHETLTKLTGIEGGKEETKTETNDKQNDRIISTYEITSLLMNYQKGVVSFNNGVKLLGDMGISKGEAERMLNDTKLIEVIE